jgi:hypothetical protein
LSADDFPTTEEGSNWTVVVFKCPRKNWTETLRSLYSELDRQGLSLIPHYEIRSFEQKTDSFLITFRILREQRHEEAIKSLIEKFMAAYEHEIDPEKGNRFASYHAWFLHRDRSAKWTEEKCRILNKISKFVLEIIDSGTLMEVRYEWLHLFANMAAIFQIKEVCWTAETYPNSIIMSHT